KATRSLSPARYSQKELCDGKEGEGNVDNDLTLATERRSQHHKAKDVAMVLNDTDFTHLLEDVGYYGSLDGHCKRSTQESQGHPRLSRRGRGTPDRSQNPSS
ncbi:unnamed protein product, partial [Choristocarpus tenellus]